jgi:diguanylate cyclase (GGDEF)-like protein
MATQLAVSETRDGRILVVDDSEVVRVMVSAMLRDAGYTVSEAENGQRAIDLLAREEFDVVITDLRMPEKDGFEVLEAVRRRSLHTEVIILTGTHAQDVSCAVRALRLGAHDFLTKPPAGPLEVIVTVDRALEKKRLKESNLRLLREMEGLSRTDALTGIWNRRAFEETMRREVLRAQRYDLPLSMLLLDIDHFKAVNDVHGHQMGDEVLKWFAQQASRVLREGDTLHRYGGEEFAVLLPHIDLGRAQLVADRVLLHLAESPFRDLNITASAGVASGHGKALADLDLVAAADAALYRAKREGRNRSVAAHHQVALLH